MKIEFISPEPEGGLNEYSYIYITKGEFIKAYKNNKNKAYNDFKGIIEMFTTPACFYKDISIECFDKIYANLQQSKFKGICLNYDTRNSNTSLQIFLLMRMKGDK